MTKTKISVQPQWCLELPLQQQSVLLLAARGPDGIDKNHPCKRVWKAYRACVLLAARKGRELNVGEKASKDPFMGLDEFGDDLPWADVVEAFFHTVDSLPHHGYQHLMLGAEILGYKHPNTFVANRWKSFYHKCVDNLHLTPESETAMNDRLSDWNRKDWD